MTVLFGILAVLSGIYLTLSPSLPSVEALKEIELQTPLRVFSKDGKLIGEFGEKRRDPVVFEEVPTALVDAVLAAEDDSFYSHSGVDIKGLLRAASQLLVSGEIQSGGSTITMQVARNFFLSRNQTFSRKFNEILLAIKIEQELSKEEILELYFNKIYLGNRSYGVKAAAQVYYGRSLKDLSLAQIAMIAGLPKAPSTFNPIINPSRALLRRDWILGRMLSLDKITEEEHKLAIAESVSATYHGQNLDLYAPYVAEIARDKAVEILGDLAYTDGYSVYTTIDSRLQEAGQAAVVKGLLDYDGRHGYRGAESTLDPTQLKPLITSSPADQDTQNSRLPSTVVSVENNQLGAVNLIPWAKALKKIPTYANLKPAAVVKIEDKQVTAILGDGQAITINWEDGLSDAGKYVNEDFYGKKPKKASSVVKLGDVIRVYEKEPNRWIFSQIPAIQGALVAISPQDGSIRTIVGGFDFHQSSFNRVTQAKRQPGSNFKPFVYAVGLERGLTPASIFNDSPIVVEDSNLENTWRPENASGKFYGPTRLRKALYLSRNLVSIRLLRNIGINKAQNGVRRFGIDKKTLPNNLSMALGSNGMTPLELATGFSVFANNGYKVEPYIIERITDRQDQDIFAETPLSVSHADDSENGITQPSQQAQLHNVSLYSSSETNIELENTPTFDQKSLPPLETKPAPRVLDSRISYLMNSMLRDVVQYGTAKKAKRLQRSDIGGKTGTTNGPIDAWFTGFNQHLVASAWVGFDDNSKIGKREFGGTAALPIWMDFMKVALKDVPESLPPQPNGIVTVLIDPETGERTAANNPKGIKELFLKETAPKEISPDDDFNPESNLRPEDIF